MDRRLVEVYTAVTRNSQETNRAPDALRRLSKEDVEKEIELCRNRVEAGKRALTQTIAMYQPLFGTPPVLNASYSEMALRSAEKDFFDTGLRKVLFTPQTGLFAKKPKTADYQRFCRSAQMLVEGYTVKLSQLEQRLEELTTGLQQRLGEIRLGLENARANIRTDAEAWSTYPSPMDYSKELYMGELEMPVETEFADDYRQLGMVATDDGSDWLRIPFTYNAYEPFATLVSFEGETRDGEGKLGNMVRSLIYQIIHTMPPYSYELLYLDPTHGGAGLRELLTELGNTVDGNAYQLHEKLYPDNVYRLLRVASSKEQVREELKNLETRIARINSICAGQTVTQFNAPQFDENGQIKENNKGVVPQVFVFYENTHGRLDSGTLELLQKIADCSTGSGISLVLTSIREKGQMLTQEEEALLKTEMTRDDFDHIEILPDGCSLYANADVMGESADKNLFFNFNPYFADTCQRGFLAKVSEGFRPSLQKETAYEKRIDLDAAWGSSDGENEIRIPIGVNLQDKVVYLELGNPAAAHALMAGSTGCGKSSFLHTIINGVITHYKPTDVQLWLSDYKTAEFRRYMVDTPPHIAYVGIDRSVEYSLSFIDRLYNEYERRLRAFGTCTSVSEYRRLHGADSMPRILVVVDEFHVMSNHVKEFPDYKMKLAALLRETRAMGMTFLFADQTCGVGLQGLSEDGKLQLTCRMAMRTTIEEYNAVYNITNAKDVIQTQDKFEVTLQRMVTQLDSLGKVNTRVYYERCKTLFANPDLRGEIARRSIAAYGPAKDPVFAEEPARARADWQLIAREEADMPAQRGIQMYMGAPLSLQKHFAFRLMANYGENVVNVVPDENILSSLFFTQLENIRRQGEYEIYIVADENDSLFNLCELELDRLAAEDRDVHIVTFIGDVCDTVMQLRQTMIKRRRMRTFGRIAVFWIGLAGIALEMGYLPAERPERSGAAPVQKRTVQDDLNAQFAALFGVDDDLPTPAQEEPEEDWEDECGYNATEDIAELMTEGPKRSIHNFCYFPSVGIALKTKCAPITGSKASFTHKIALGIGKEEAMDYFGASRLTVNAEGKPLDNNTAVYYNGRAATQFLPFIGPAEESFCNA